MKSRDCEGVPLTQGLLKCRNFRFPLYIFSTVTLISVCSGMMSGVDAMKVDGAKEEAKPSSSSAAATDETDVAAGPSQIPQMISISVPDRALPLPENGVLDLTGAQLHSLEDVELPESLTVGLRLLQLFWHLF